MQKFRKCFLFPAILDVSDLQNILKTLHPLFFIKVGHLSTLIEVLVTDAVVCTCFLLERCGFIGMLLSN